MTFYEYNQSNKYLLRFNLLSKRTHELLGNPNPLNLSILLTHCSAFYSAYQLNVVVILATLPPSHLVSEDYRGSGGNELLEYYFI